MIALAVFLTPIHLEPSSSRSPCSHHCCDPAYNVASLWTAAEDRDKPGGFGWPCLIPRTWIELAWGTAEPRPQHHMLTAASFTCTGKLLDFLWLLCSFGGQKYKWISLGQSGYPWDYVPSVGYEKNPVPCAHHSPWLLVHSCLRQHLPYSASIAQSLSLTLTFLPHLWPARVPAVTTRS